ncbi:MAG: hypothetical protein EZS28_039531 [Streblomastix strix]|uniref:Uncharacterized protein n=1 Tax=Streblomastix strix TaxID=222440 RepID=A0A5J4U4S5_9EUKA|nr:MAG: hypothetical protein EZS28_039531 [Streblomastix strix]
MQGGVGAGKMDINCTSMERINMVDSHDANYSTLDGARRELKHPQGRNMDKDQQSESKSGEDLDFFGQSIQEIIDGWHGSWKRHACSLTIFAEYWAQQSGTVLQLSTLKQPYLTIANYITYLKPLESDACITYARNSISTLFELMGKSMNFKRKIEIEQLMQEHVNSTAKVRKEIRYWKLSQLMHKISNIKNGRSTNDGTANREHQLRRSCSSHNDHEKTPRTTDEDLKGCIRQNYVPNQVDIELVGQERGEGRVKEGIGLEKQKEGEGVECGQVQQRSQISVGGSGN